MTDLEIRQLDFKGLSTLMDWAALEGWNTGKWDADAFWAADPEGFLGIYDGDKLIAGGSIVRYPPSFGFMGLFIVRPDWRGKGVGRDLWFKRRDLLLSRLDKEACIGMDGVVAMQGFYNKGGFEPVYRELRYLRKGESLRENENVFPIVKADFDRIKIYDHSIVSYERAGFLKPWLFLPDRMGFKFEYQGELKGYALVRKVNEGYKIGPLFADDPKVAESLYRSCLNAAKDEPVAIDVPMVNEEALDLVKRYEASDIYECARMYYGEPPEQKLNNIYGVTCFELG